MNINLKFVTTGLVMAVLAASSGITVADGHGSKDANYCMDVEIGSFHMQPGFATPEGACAVKDYWDGRLQDKFYPFTKEDHRFNCDVFGDTVPLPLGDVPSSVVSQGNISGTIGGHPFEAKLLCASMTNYYEQFCDDPTDPNAPCFQLAQPFLKEGLPFPRVTEVSVFDGAITVERGNKTVAVPIVLATRAAGITHVEDLTAPLVGASITHSLLGMVTYDADEDEGDRDMKELDGSADLLLQGHIFYPGPVEEDLNPDGTNAAAVIKGSICSKDLYKKLNRRGGR